MNLGQKVSATAIIIGEALLLGIFASIVIGSAAIVGFIRWNIERIILVWCPEPKSTD